ncbi:prolyl oligopeptidase family serine peptidase [Edaphobacter flagellatus]|uniref:prolyl oligopeptidase family serine peptidase n=1 Tax=Edaphobacter flagellatus TaxID=1933044 RepID=UPI0021B2E350|nr:prolyl oligopeptidase family serine peptidase [Edaphobacter flagellatus]
MASSQEDIDEYAIDQAGNTVVFAKKEQALMTLGRSEEDIDRGYRILPNSIPSIAMTWRSRWVPYRIWVIHRVGARWAKPQTVPIHSPFTGKRLDTVRCAVHFNFSFSPDGAQFLVNISDIDMAKGEELDGTPLPAEWLQSPTYKRRVASGGLVWITVLQDLKSAETSMPFKTTGATGTPQWSPDGTSFYIVAASPVGTEWEKQDESAHPTPWKPWHIWRVSMINGVLERVAEDITDPANVILWVKPDSLLIRSVAGHIIRLRRVTTGWATTAQSIIPDTDEESEAIASNGTFGVTGYERSDTSPQLRVYNVNTGSLISLTKLNPTFDVIELAPSETFHWKTSNGTNMTGTLIKPLGYESTKRYPLVIQTKSSQSSFVCDAGSSHAPSFAPQPVAAAGMLYLILKDGERNAKYPLGYPGNISEAVFYTDVWDSAVKELANEGLVDSDRVGIIGFSRTGWHVEFALVHGKTHYAAATVTDNVQYNLSEYWLSHTEAQTRPMDLMYGGPPYGTSLDNWKRYSISFNLEKIHTPLLMEVMGEGVLDDKVGASPYSLNLRYEVLTGLNRLKKPVELYYYPSEQHQPEHPQARLASVQRNLDWYRFWLQGDRSSAPVDPEQYQRWQNLKHMSDENRRH